MQVLFAVCLTSAFAWDIQPNPQAYSDSDGECLSLSKSSSSPPVVSVSMFVVPFIIVSPFVIVRASLTSGAGSGCFTAHTADPATLHALQVLQVLGITLLGHFFAMPGLLVPCVPVPATLFKPPCPPADARARTRLIYREIRGRGPGFWLWRW